MNEDTQIYHNTEKNITLTKNLLTAGDCSYASKNISSVHQSNKEKALWPSVTLLLWGALVFYNDSLPAQVGIEQNSSLFKWVLVLCGIGWFIYRSKSGAVVNVSIVTDGNEVTIATTKDQSIVDEIISNIKKII